MKHSTTEDRRRLALLSAIKLAVGHVGAIAEELEHRSRSEAPSILVDLLGIDPGSAEAVLEVPLRALTADGRAKVGAEIVELRERLGITAAETVETVAPKPELPVVGLVPEYFTDGLLTGIGEADSDQFRISSELRADVQDWNDWWEGGRIWDSAAILLEFRTRGFELALRLQEELGEEVCVVFDASDYRYPEG